jgi:hypothetical protein
MISVGTLAEYPQGNVELGGSEKGESITGCVHTALISNVVFKQTYNRYRRLSSREEGAAPSGRTGWKYLMEPTG